jgi:pimeloyl-ACP methyl ester carboxylesterase
MVRRSLGCALLFLAGCSASSTDDEAQDSEVVASGDVALSASLPVHCTGPEMVRIARPATDGKTFAYGFRFKAPTKPGAPVVVSLPGGPGQSSTESPPPFLPEGWGYLLTDPRGVGCNTLASVPSGDASGEFFTTENLADDVIAALADRHLDAYLLYGVSYGTLLGTTIVHKLEKSYATPPKAVILEGVLGRAFGEDFAGAEYIRQWERVHAILPADVRTELETKPEPFGMTRIEWSRTLMGLLMASPTFVANLVSSLSTTIPEVTPEIRAQALAQLKANGAAPHLTDPGARELYRQIACREIMDTVPENDLDVIFEKGKLVRNKPEEGTKCAGLTVTKPYDAAKLPFKTKVYYFIGESDVATAAWQGEYHFKTHDGPAVKIVTRGGGHNSLQLNQEACAPALVSDIATGGANIDAVLATCPAKVDVEKKGL